MGSGFLDIDPGERQNLVSDCPTDQARAVQIVETQIAICVRGHPLPTERLNVSLTYFFNLME
jgi:hypothetical protein